MNGDSADPTAPLPSADPVPDDALARYIVALTIENLDSPGTRQPDGAAIATWNLLRLLDDYRYDAVRIEPPWPADVASALDHARAVAFDDTDGKRLVCRALATTLYQLRLQRVVAEPYRTQASLFFGTLADAIAPRVAEPAPRNQT